MSDEHLRYNYADYRRTADEALGKMAKRTSLELSLYGDTGALLTEASVGIGTAILYLAASVHHVGAEIVAAIDTAGRAR